MTTPSSRAPLAGTMMSRLDPTLRGYAQRVLEWVAPDDDDIDAISGAEMLYFTWYQLPTKWHMSLPELATVARAAAEVMRVAGRPRIADLISSAQTTKIHAAWRTDQDEAVQLVETALDGSGLEPPDTDLLIWGRIMGTGEARARVALAAVLEKAIDASVFAPGKSGWRRTRANLTEAWLTTRSLAFGGSAPLDMIHAERREGWNLAQSPAHRATLAPVLALLDADPTTVAEPSPLVWLLEQVGDGVTLTQAGYLPTVMIPLAQRWYPDWFLPGFVIRSEADLPPLRDLRGFATRLKLLTRRGRRLTVSAAGRAALAEPTKVDFLAATGWFGPAEFIASVGEVAAARLLVREATTTELVAMAWTAVSPTFLGPAGERPSRADVEESFRQWWRLGRVLGYIADAEDSRVQQRLTAAGRVAAVTGLRQRARAPRGHP